MKLPMPPHVANLHATLEVKLTGSRLSRPYLLNPMAHSYKILGSLRYSVRVNRKLQQKSYLRPAFAIYLFIGGSLDCHYPGGSKE